MIAFQDKPERAEATRRALLNEARWLVRRSIAPRLRTLREFAEQEIIIPDGPFQGRRFKTATQPYAGQYFDAVDSGKWNRFAATGPSQSGKTLTSVVIPVLYHLFEIVETVICGVPHMEMAFDKWKQDFEPAIAASRYADLLPERGKGSRGGSFTSIVFRNGAMLRFMTGGGDDKTKAGFTSRVLAVTETDGLDESSDTSRESDPLKQMEARTRAYGNKKRVYLECTVSTTNGRIWQEYQQGTKSRLMLPCLHCGEYVQPEREHLLGWQDAQSEMEAERNAAFFCPHCATGWSEEQRAESNRSAKLIHGEQTIDSAGVVSGAEPETRTLGFRWSAVNNLFSTTEQLGGEEWRAQRDVDEDNAQRERNQFVWCVPHDGDVSTVTDLSDANIMGRMSDLRRGELPAVLQGITVGVDVGKYLLHWTAKAWSGHPTGYTHDYGVIEVHSRDFGEETAIIQALRQLRGMLLTGWPRGDGKENATPLCVLIDSGYCTDAVYKFCEESGLPFMPSKGLGYSQYLGWKYGKPTSTGQKIRWIGDGCHVARIQNGVELVEVDADFWKTRTHSRLECEPSEPGAIQLYKTDSPREHFTYAKHLTAEKKVEEFIAGRGLVVRWEKIRRNNHYLDTESLANVAGHLAEIEAVKTANVERAKSRIMIETRPDGRDWL